MSAAAGPQTAYTLLAGRDGTGNAVVIVVGILIFFFRVWEKLGRLYGYPANAYMPRFLPARCVRTGCF